MPRALTLMLSWHLSACSFARSLLSIDIHPMISLIAQSQDDEIQITRPPQTPANSVFGSPDHNGHAQAQVCPRVTLTRPPLTESETQVVEEEVNTSSLRTCARMPCRRQYAAALKAGVECRSRGKGARCVSRLWDTVPPKGHRGMVGSQVVVSRPRDTVRNPMKLWSPIRT